MFFCYYVSRTYVIEKYVSLSFCLKPYYYPPMFLCYSVFKTYVIEKYVSLSFCLKPCYYNLVFVCYYVFICVLLSKNFVTITLCSYVTMSLSVFFCLIRKPPLRTERGRLGEFFTLLLVHFPLLSFSFPPFYYLSPPRLSFSMIRKSLWPTRASILCQE